MASFTLQCTICPKDPTFSDVSHLLTHMGSKGHLSHHFKAQVRSRQDLSVREKLQTYDQWYQKNEIEHLLSQRLNIKESKTHNRKVPYHCTTASQQRTTSKAVRSKKSPRAKTRQHSAEQSEQSVIDPDLPQPIRTSSYGPVTTQQKTSLRIAQADPDDLHEQKGLYCNLRSSKTTQSRVSKLKTNLKEDDQVPEDGDYIPRFTQRKRQHLASSSNSRDTRKALQSSIDKDVGKDYCENSPHKSQAENYDQDNEGDVVSESARLKGIIWPGMNLFDSASPDAKKMRNQKKGDAILALMETNADLIEPTEVIYFPTWEMKKERFISGEVESSPILEQLSKRKRSSTRGNKAPLTDLSLNGSRLEKQQRTRKITRNINESQSSILEEPFPRYAIPFENQEFQSGINMQSTHEDANIEWKMTFGKLSRNKRRAFGVYRGDSALVEDGGFVELEGERIAVGFQENGNDTSGSQIDQSVQSLFQSPSLDESEDLMNSKMFTHHSLPAINAVCESPHEATRTGRSMTENKENIEPIIDSHGNIDLFAPLAVGNYSKQRYSTAQGNTQTTFHDIALHRMDFVLLHNRPATLHTANPLAQCFQTQRPQEKFNMNTTCFNQQAGTIINPFHGARKFPFGEREGSSGDETIDQGIGEDFGFLNQG